MFIEGIPPPGNGKTMLIVCMLGCTAGNGKTVLTVFIEGVPGNGKTTLIVRMLGCTAGNGKTVLGVCMERRLGIWLNDDNCVYREYRVMVNRY